MVYIFLISINSTRHSIFIHNPNKQKWTIRLSIFLYFKIFWRNIHIYKQSKLYWIQALYTIFRYQNSPSLQINSIACLSYKYYISKIRTNIMRRPHKINEAQIKISHLPTQWKTKEFSYLHKLPKYFHAHYALGCSQCRLAQLPALARSQGRRSWCYDSHSVYLKKKKKKGKKKKQGSFAIPAGHKQNVRGTAS